jgi:hypothetical protein
MSIEIGTQIDDSDEQWLNPVGETASGSRSTHLEMQIDASDEHNPTHPLQTHTVSMIPPK